MTLFFFQTTPIRLSPGSVLISNSAQSPAGHFEQLESGQQSGPEIDSKINLKQAISSIWFEPRGSNQSNIL